MAKRPTHGNEPFGEPIEPRYAAKVERLGRFLEEVLNRDDPHRRTGFMLVVFQFEDDSGRCNYISNARREDVKQLLREQLARLEEMGTPVGHA